MIVYWQFGTSELTASVTATRSALGEKEISVTPCCAGYVQMMFLSEIDHKSTARSLYTAIIRPSGERHANRGAPSITIDSIPFVTTTRSLSSRYRVHSECIASGFGRSRRLVGRLRPSPIEKS